MYIYYIFMIYCQAQETLCCSTKLNTKEIANFYYVIFQFVLMVILLLDFIYYGLLFECTKECFQLNVLIFHH